MKQDYSLVFNRSIPKDLAKIPGSILRVIREKIDQLALNPFPPGSLPIEGRKNCYRIRVGAYRIVYEVATTIRIITIIRVRHRKHAYKHK
jgi:mRNA interferase RelE/StbE